MRHAMRYRESVRGQEGQKARGMVAVFGQLRESEEEGASKGEDQGVGV